MKANKKLPKIKGAQFYKVGDKVETIKPRIGAWFAADIIDISPNSKCECQEECQCTYKLLFEGNDDDEEVEVVDRKLNEIREVSYSSLDWDKLQVGMKVVINYNINKPKQWGYWYDYVIEDLQKRDDVYYLKGTLLVGYDGKLKKLSVKIDSDNVADVLEIRPPITLREKEMSGYETGVKPEYCKKCHNKPKVRCKTCCCCKCGNKKDFELTVQCDECADWFHIYCLRPPLEQLPSDEDWYCPECNNETLRAKLERREKVRKQRVHGSVKSSPKKPKEMIPESSRSPSKSPQGSVINDEQIFDVENVEMEELTKEIPKTSNIWWQVEQLYPAYDLVRVMAHVTRKGSEIIVPFGAEEYITKDVANEHLWKEAKRSLVNGKEEFLKTVKRIFTCAICRELLDDPITLSCKHSFCIDCFFKSLSVNVYNCALCRIPVIHTQHYVVNENLKNALALLFGKKIAEVVEV